MKNPTRKRSAARGTTVVETLVAVGLMLPVMLAIQNLTTHSGRMFAGGTAAIDSQRQAEAAVQRLARDLRAARGPASGTVLTGTSPVLCLQMPSYDASGALVVPLSDGHTVTYALSGDGRQLTRTETGGSAVTIVRLTSGEQMQVAYGSAAVDANGDGTLQWSEYVSLSPSITVTSTVGGASAFNSAFTATQEVMMRNH